MDVKLSEEQLQLRDSARKFLAEECTADFIRGIEQSEQGFSAGMWRQMAEMGWLGIGLPEDCGGLGMSILDTAILMKELGRRICPSPFLPTLCIAAEAIVRVGSDEQKAGLAETIDGKDVIAFAYQEATRDFDPGAVRLPARADGDGWVLDGTKMFVEFAAAADRLLVVARTAGARPSRDGLTLFLVDAQRTGICCTRTPTVARDHHYKVVFDGVKVGPGDVLGSVGGAGAVLEPVLEKAAVLWSAYVIGVSEQMHEFATRYAKDRVQFGRPIGQMQTIQGYLATLIIEIYGANTLMLFTAFNLDKGRSVRAYVAKTKAFSAETVKNTTDVGSQIFGGMGYMEESDSTLYLRRGRQYKAMLGGTDYWEKIIAEELLDAPA